MIRFNCLAVLSLAFFGAALTDDSTDIGNTRQLFVDSSLVGELQNAALVLGQPREAGQVLRFDQPWEGPFSAYATVLHDGSRFQLYYRGKELVGRDGSSDEVTCYAESSDGIRWSKPELGLYEVSGTRKNNVILAAMVPFSHNFTPFLDTRPGIAASQRYKAVAGLNASGLVGFVSADGVHWRKIREPAIIPSPSPGSFDSQNVAFWAEHEQKYVCYIRTWKKVDGVSYRWVSRTTSQNFLDWTPAVEMDYGTAPPEHLYTNQTSPYFRSPGYYIAVCARFEPNRQVLTEDQAKALGVDLRYNYKESSDAVLMTSRGGNRYDRTFLEAFLRPGLGLENWIPRSNYPALNIVPTSPSEMSFYVTRNYGQPTAYLARYSLRLDALASLRAPYAGGSLTTVPIRFSGARLEINYSTSAAGGIRVELQDENKLPIAGYSAADCKEIIGDETRRVVEWKGSPDVSALARRPIRMKILLKDADLYSFRFSEYP